MGGTLECFSNFLGSGRRHKKRKQFQTVELKVRMDCEGCELKVRNALSTMRGSIFFSSDGCLCDQCSNAVLTVLARSAVGGHQQKAIQGDGDGLC